MLQDQVVDLVEEGLDLAVRLGRLPGSTLIARPLASARLVVCGAPAYLDTHGVPETPADLPRHNCLVYTQWLPRGEWRFKNRNDEFTVPVSGSFQDTTGDALRIAAIHGCGLVQLATYVVGPDLKAGTLRPSWMRTSPIRSLFMPSTHTAAISRPRFALSSTSCMPVFSPSPTGRWSSNGVERGISDSRRHESSES